MKQFRDVRIELTKALDVSDLLLGGLVDKDVITQYQHDQILVRCFTVFVCFHALYNGNVRNTLDW